MLSNTVFNHVQIVMLTNLIFYHSAECVVFNMGTYQLKLINFDGYFQYAGVLQIQ
jgi:hypothetical protein